MLIGVSAILALCVFAPSSAHGSQPAFVYVDANPDHATNSVSAVHLGKDGQSTPVPGSPYTTGGLGLAPAIGAELVHRIEAVRSRNLLFVANDGSGSISAFVINPFDGTLSAVPGSPFTVDGWSAFSGISLAGSGDGQFLYASGTTVVSFSIEANGALSPSGSEWSLGQRVGGVAATNDNTRLFLSTPTRIVILHCDQSGLTADAPDFLSVGSTPTDLRLDSESKHLWVGTKNGGILAYSVTPSSVDIIPGAPFFLNVSDLSGLSVDAFGRFLFAYSNTGPRLLGARTNPDGSLALGPNSPLTPALVSTGGALTPDGSLLFLSDALGQLDAWSTADGGALTHAPGYPLTVGTAHGFSSIATFPDKNPTPAPATTRWLALTLAAALALLGARRAHRPSLA